jgi:hypothetical protein
VQATSCPVSLGCSLRTTIASDNATGVHTPRIQPTSAIDPFESRHPSTPDRSLSSRSRPSRSSSRKPGFTRYDSMVERHHHNELDQSKSRRPKKPTIMIPLSERDHPLPPPPKDEEPAIVPPSDRAKRPKAFQQRKTTLSPNLSNSDPSLPLRPK